MSNNKKRKEDELEYDSFEEFEAFLFNHHVDKSDDYDSDEDGDEDEDKDDSDVATEEDEDFR